MTATVTGAGELVGLVIKPEAVDPADTTSGRPRCGCCAGRNHRAQAVATSKLTPLAGGWAWAADFLSNEFSMYEGLVQDLIDELATARDRAEECPAPGLPHPGR